MNNYTITHLHSDFSSGTTNIDSITKYTDYIDKAKECGMKAIAFTEHGNVFSWLHKKEYCEKQGLKYIHGIEAYITESLENKVRDNYHCVLLAKNYEGVKEINKLSSASFNREDGHFYYMPRISIDELINTSDNIIVCTACLASILSRGEGVIKEQFLTFLINNKHRCFLEIQHHNDKDQIQYNKELYQLHKNFDIPMITGTDTHALNKEHLKGRSILQKAKGVHFENEDSWDLSFKNYDDLIKAYKKQKSLPMDVVLEAIENTNKVADMVEEFEIDRSYKYPHLWENPLELFKQKIQDGIKKRGVDKYDNYQEYLDRIDHEMEAYIHNGAIDFMLLMDDILTWCRANDIEVGYGRGSVNGSVIAWLLEITEMDSIKHNLNFDRFMNIERVSLSDIDTDFPPSRIEDVKQYIFNRHGLYCSDIITFNTIADKGAIRDVGRALNIPLSEVGKICDSVDNEEAYMDMRNKYKELFEYVDLVKGTIVSIGSHPCGVIVCENELEDAVGLCTTSTSAYPISQLNMKEIDSLNYVKLDLLKLDTADLINGTCKLAGIPRLTPDNVDINDKKVWDAIRDDTTQIFQWEGSTGDSYIKKLLSDENIEKFKEVNENIDRMTLLSIGNSAIRPAGASYRDDLANGVVRKTGSKPIDDFLSNTFGYLVFQCQIIEFLHEYCGFTMGEADIVRRGFAKKTGTDKYIPIIKNGGNMPNSEHHIEGFIKTMKDKYGIDERKSEEDIVAFIQVIEDASSYLFSLNHSAPYSYEGYVSGWLRTYYPLEFLTTALNINSDKQKKTAALTKYAKKLNIDFKPPRFRYSQAGYFCDKESNSIYKGIGSIKNLNDNVAEEMYMLREIKYNSFVDLLFDLKQKTSLNARQRDILIKINFFEEFGDINKMLKAAELFDEMYGKQSISLTKAEEYGISHETFMKSGCEFKPRRVDDIDFQKYVIDHYPDVSLKGCEKKKRDGTPNGYSLKKFVKKYEISEEDLFKYATKIVDGKYSDYNLRTVLKNHIESLKIPECTLADKMKYQLEFLGYVDYVDASVDSRYLVITDLDTKYSPKFKAYCIKNGESLDMKVKKKLVKRDPAIKTCFTDTPFEDGDIIYVNKFRKEPRKRKTESGWENVPGEWNWWCIDYRKVSNIA